LLFVRLLFRFSVEGRQHLPASGPFIITPNHSCPLDLQLLATALPTRCGRESCSFEINPDNRATS
jgi:1-acyl-sn-glycerol-3-phosphate acyltransferase